MQPGILRGGLSLSFRFTQRWHWGPSWQSSQPWEQGWAPTGLRRRAGRGACSVLTCVCPSQHAMPFWRVSSHSDLMALHHALELEYLWPPRSTFQLLGCSATRSKSSRPESRVGAALANSPVSTSRRASAFAAAVAVNEGPRLCLQNSRWL